jgi:hypothetical protein
METLLRQLNRRVERLNEEIEMKAPKVVIRNELGLISKACIGIAEKLDIDLNAVEEE